MLNTIKILLNIKDNSQDELLSFYINLVEDEIRNYCNIDSIPKELENLEKLIVLELYNSRNEDNVESIKRGDTEIKYAVVKVKSFIENYYLQLNQFKRLRTLW